MMALRIDTLEAVLATRLRLRCAGDDLGIEVNHGGPTTAAIWTGQVLLEISSGASCSRPLSSTRLNSSTVDMEGTDMAERMLSTNSVLLPAAAEVYRLFFRGTLSVESKSSLPPPILHFLPERECRPATFAVASSLNVFSLLSFLQSLLYA